ncbi:MAG TPA: peptidase M23 [Clostridiales bacterium UBA8153]|nr:peptidase M23 [Clostridiales bacterium UBA8153]
MASIGKLGVWVLVIILSIGAGEPGQLCPATVGPCAAACSFGQLLDGVGDLHYRLEDETAEPAAVPAAGPALVSAFQLYVDEVPIVAVATEEAALAVMTRVRELVLEALSPGGRTELRGVRVRETVTVRQVQTAAENISEADMAASILLRGTTRVLAHTVQRGQSLWSIAQANAMTTEQLRRANPSLTSDRLQIGQQLNLVVPEPHVTVETVERRTYTEAIGFGIEVTLSPELWPWEERVQRPGVSGQREVTVDIRRENGREISRTVVSNVVVREPVAQLLVRGSREVPSPGTGVHVWPLNGRITSDFGWRSLGWHNGVDIAAPIGTPIRAAGRGVVVFAAARGGYGRLIVIDHGQQGSTNLATAYAHLSRFAVRVGQSVEAGEVIGYVGNTGRSTGPHLHFEVHIDGERVDPIAFFEGR